MDATKYISLHELSRKSGLPIAWLKAEAKANRIPALRVGRRLMFNVDAVKLALSGRADGVGEGGCHD